MPACNDFSSRRLVVLVSAIIGFFLATTLFPLSAFAALPHGTGYYDGPPIRVRPGSQSVAAAGVVHMAAAEEGCVWYLAEGYTGGDFDTWVLVQNPGEEAAAVTLEFQLPAGTSAEPFSFDLAPRSRQSINLDILPGLASTDVSTKVTSSKPVVVERAVYFNYNGRTGGHDSTGVTGTSNIWYLAEGYTGGDFDTWVLVQNPGEYASKVTLEFQLPPGASADPFVFDLAPGSRQSINLDILPGLADTDVSVLVSSTEPVVAERAMYFDYNGKTGGHDSTGVTYPAPSWYLAEGYTGGDFDTWVLVQNPGEESAAVTLEFQLPPGSSADPVSIEVPAKTRRSIHLDDLPGLSSTDVSTKIVANKPVVAERAMYFDYKGKTDGHDSAGVIYPGETWYLAEGYTGGDFDTWVLVQNPGEESAAVTLEFQLPGGTSADPFSFDLAPRSRQSVNLDILPGLASTDVSTTVTADKPVVAERAMYFDYNGKDGGHVSAGYRFRPTVKQDNANVFDAADMSELKTWSPDGKTMTFEGGAEAAGSVKAGDIIVSGVTPESPDGLMVKVADVSKSGGDIVIATEPACLEEVFQQTSISLDETYTKDDIVSSASAADGDDFAVQGDEQGEGFYIDIPRITLFGNSIVGVFLDGSLNFKPHVNFSFDINFDPWAPLDTSLNRLNFSVGLTEEARLELLAGISAQGAKAINIPGTTIKLPTIQFAAGPVPVVIVPKLNFIAGCSGEVSAGWEASITQTATATAGIYYSNGGWNNYSSFTNDFDFELPSLDDFSVKLDFKPFIGPQLKMLLYGVAGPYAQIRCYLQFIKEFVNNPHWELYAGLELVLGLWVGVEIDLGFKKISLTLARYELPTPLGFRFLLLRSIDIDSIEPGTGPPGTTVTINGDGFGGSRGNSFVSFGNWRPAADDYISWSDDKIRCKVPMQGWGKVDVKVTRPITPPPPVLPMSFDLESNPYGFSIQPHIDTIDPTVGPQGTVVNITGRGFGPNQGSSCVSFGPDQVTNYISWSNTQVLCNVPAAASGTIPVTVTTTGGKSNGISFEVRDEWGKTFGGSASDRFASVVKVADGYVAAGSTRSGGSGGSDGWLVKTDLAGNKVYERWFGGAGDDYFTALQQTSDGGFIICGSRDVSGDAQGWLVKTDAGGNVASGWPKTYGGANADGLNSVQLTSDGGFIAAGSTEISLTDEDGWLLKTDASGNAAAGWPKNYGGSSYDTFRSVIPVADGYVMAGEKYMGGVNYYDGWLLKTGLDGTQAWEKTFAGVSSSWDSFYSIESVSGGFIVTGTKGVASGQDGWLVKTDTSGNESWQKTYGGANGDYLYDVIPLANGTNGYMCAGSTASSGAGNSDAWFIRTDSSGNATVQDTYGGSWNDAASCLIRTPDGGCIMAGYRSTNNGDQYNNGWLIKRI